ncbi:nucleotide-diphospho-sugar transferase [Dimargaris cristalligena]|uniref:Nucleotide-diphospho-sugar transferase n=1 Tax=Dimargaris cristalligena TaxID=215637 RepID=A0A4P9ZPA0_9FUNG|nr:nucleotide-diphospho-sugar transferase [Dimargaris cristalligena]|eukprot:RKP35264.1 nucleotide-diphospho-sugar transferase [Dimargaris cristalligena]
MVGDLDYDSLLTTTDPSGSLGWSTSPGHASKPRVKACFVILTRNSELAGLETSIRQLEQQFNHRHHYPYVILNDEPFAPELERSVRGLTGGANTTFGVIPQEHWGYPSWINQTQAADARRRMANVMYGGSESYRHMCRFESGFFFRHPLLAEFDYYWRVEPGVQFTCAIDYDPFVFMHERDIKYGFTISLKEIPATVESLWPATLDYMRQNRAMVPIDNTLAWVVDPDIPSTYNLCHFWSNFEIASLAFFRSEQYLSYFNHLDRAGGFYYERWGDAPVHSLAATMFLRRDQIHWFQDIGYVHASYENCPSDPVINSEKCTCNPRRSVDRVSFSCTREFMHLTPEDRLDVDGLL